MKARRIKKSRCLYLDKIQELIRVKPLAERLQLQLVERDIYKKAAMCFKNWIVRVGFFSFLFISVQFIFFYQNSLGGPSNKTLNLAIIPHRSNLGNEHSYAVFIKFLEQETGINFRWTGSRTYSDVIEKLRTKKADIAYVGPFAYVEAQDAFGVRLICRTLSSKSMEFYHSMIVTRKDSGADSLLDLKGRSFAFTDPKSTSGFLFPMARLMKAGIQLGDFSRVDYVKRHANSIYAVYNGQSYAGATSHTAIDKVKINFDEIKILWKSDPIYRGPWVAQKDMPDELFFKIQKTMLKINRHKDAEAIFESLTTKGFVRGYDHDYNNVREVVKLIPQKSEQGE